MEVDFERGEIERAHDIKVKALKISYDKLARLMDCTYEQVRIYFGCGSRKSNGCNLRRLAMRQCVERIIKNKEKELSCQIIAKV